MKEILFPVGRMIGGSLSKMFQSTDNKGNPKFKAGTTEPLMRVNFGVAIVKGTETHWNQTPWGADIHNEGATGYPTGEFNSPTFAWKVIDGDSQIPNKKGKKPCDCTGYAGHWVIWFSQSWMPKKVNAAGTQELTDEKAILPGYYIQVLGSCKDNKPSESPGVYLNPIAVALSGYGEPLSMDVDTTSVGFGADPLPAGASATPIGGMPPVAPPAVAPPAVAPPAVAPAAVAPAAVAPAAVAPAAVAPAAVAPAAVAPAAVAPAAVAPAAVAPAPDFLNPPVAPVAPAMTALAGATTYEQFIEAGWTRDKLLKGGYITDDIPF